jgi:hypothetical protein
MLFSEIVGGNIFMYSNPFIINEDGKTEYLERLSLGDGGFSESWLQNKLYENPQSLPLGEIDPSYQAICPLCMEMNTNAGPIDIVYITPQGRLVVVETKLWRNPESRRKVIGQILDYAKELTKWSYADLQREVSRRTGIKGNPPYTFVSKHYPDIDESIFIDGVTYSLQNGDFMLIIAGDGIRRDAEGIVQFLQDVGHLRFTLAMIETAVYKHQSKELFVIQPRTLVKTQLVKRHIEGFNNVYHPAEGEENEKSMESWREEYYEYWKGFIGSLKLDDPEQPIANPVPAGNLIFPLPPSGSVAWINTFFYKANKEYGSYIRLSNKDIGRELYQALVDEKEDIEKDLPFKISWDDNTQMIMHSKTTEAEWPPLNDESVSKFMAETVNALVNTFRPRLDRLSGN